MPPMGLCVDCTDTELKASLGYMLEGQYRSNNVKGEITKEKSFEINRPRTSPGKIITYESKGNGKAQEYEWQRSHGNNENSKFFVTSAKFNDRNYPLKLKWKYNFFNVKKKEKYYQEHIELNPIFYKGSLFVIGPD
ncbi:uncharacterized protein METZ01_LOCUS458543, partial [marine metagenome]